MEMTSDTPLSIKNLRFRYWRREELSLRDVDLELLPGQLMLVAGASGCGKTTLMRCVNGLIPHTYRGDMEGEILLFGKSIASMEMGEISQTVGTILQDPERQILGSYVLNEVAFGLESLGLERGEITLRVERALDRLRILDLRDRETFGLSGGEKQKVALAGVLAMEPRILLLDEPLASLDPASAHEALLAFRQLADEGISIMIVEHRVEDVLSIRPDVLIYMEDGVVSYKGPAAGLIGAVDYRKVKLPAEAILRIARGDQPPAFTPALEHETGQPEPLVGFEGVRYRYRADGPEVLKGINFAVRHGDIIAILGENGSGKTTLVKHAMGLLKPSEGRVLLEGRDTRQSSVAQNARTIGYVFQSPSQMLFAPSVQEELAFGPSNLKMAPNEIVANVAHAVDIVHLKDEIEMPPLALSFGQQKRVSIAAILAMRSRILMMDEPTAGQDYWNYISFMDSILQMPGFDAVIFITHDVDLAVIYANRILLVHDGQIRADGSPFEVLKDEALLQECRVLPTSLLRLNLESFPQTGRFYRAETLAHLLG